MSYKLFDNKIIINKNDIIKNEEFIFLLSSSIFNLFSYELNLPKILLNKLNFRLLNKRLKINSKIDFFISDFIDDFCFVVHEGEFDLGLFFEEENNKVLINFISGSGKKISDVKFSVIENFFKKTIKNHKKTLKNSKKSEKIIKKQVKHLHNNKCSHIQNQIQKHKLSVLKDMFLNENINLKT